MKIAQIKNPKVGNTLLPDGSYQFGPALDRVDGKQCAGFVNDALGLTGVDHMENTLRSKINGLDFKRISDGGAPINGGYFVMNFGRNDDVLTSGPNAGKKRWDVEPGHTGLVARVTYLPDGSIDGFYTVQYNRQEKEERNESFIKKGTPEWNNILGFGIGNSVIDFQPLSLLESTAIVPTISAMYMAVHTLPQTKFRDKAKEYLHLANEALKGRI